MAGTGGDCRDGDQHARAPRATGGMTLVLVGKIGNGKSATGNSILGREVFASKRSFRSVTLECQKQSTTFGDGRIVNVIDTPGLLDTGVTAKNVGKEIFDFMGMPKDGIDAVLVVFSAVSRFSEEDTATIRSVLSSSLGERMILTFTHGDEVGKDDEFKDMLKDASEYMTEMVKSCGRRLVLFDNRTKDTLIQEGQRKELFDKVDSIMINHQERPLAVQIHPNIKKEEGAGRVNVEGWKEQVEDDRIRGHSEIHKSSEENEVLKPWYVRTYKYCAYAAEQVWNKICCLWNKLVAIVTSRVKTTKKQVEVKIFFTSYYDAQRRLLRPKLMANYCR